MLIATTMRGPTFLLNNDKNDGDDGGGDDEDGDGEDDEDNKSSQGKRAQLHFPLLPHSGSPHTAARNIYMIFC